MKLWINDFFSVLENRCHHGNVGQVTTCFVTGININSLIFLLEWVSSIKQIDKIIIFTPGMGMIAHDDISLRVQVRLGRAVHRVNKHVFYVWVNLNLITIIQKESEKKIIKSTTLSKEKNMILRCK